jgi:ArsR family transcriptional regulator
VTALRSPFAVTPAFTPADADQLAAALKAIADPMRLRILALLAEHEEMPVVALAHQLSLAQPTVSHHLKMLGDAGLIDERKVGREVLRRANADALQALSKAIDPWGGTR